MNSSQCYGRSTNQERPGRFTVETAQLNGHNFEHNSFMIAERDCNIHENRMSSRRHNPSCRTHDRLTHSPYKSETDINESLEFTVGILRVNRSNSFHCHSNSSFIWETNAPPKPPYYWSKTFRQLRDDWSSLARTNFANRGYSRVRSRSVGLPTGCEDSMRPGYPSPGEVRMMFGRATISEVPEYAASPSMLLDPPEYEDQPVRLQYHQYKSNNLCGDIETQSSVPHNGAFSGHNIDSPTRETDFIVRKKEREEPLNSCNCTNCRYAETSDMSIIKSIKKVSEWVMSSSFGNNDNNRHNYSNTEQTDSATPTGFNVDLSTCNTNKDQELKECRKRKQSCPYKDKESGNKTKLKAYVRGSYRGSSPQNRFCLEEEVYESRSHPASNNHKCSTVPCKNSCITNLRNYTGKNNTCTTLRKRVFSEKSCCKKGLQRETDCSLSPSRNRSSSRTQDYSENLLSRKRKYSSKSPFRNNFQTREIVYGPTNCTRSRKVKQQGESASSCRTSAVAKTECCSKSSRPKKKLLRFPSLSDCYDDDCRSETCLNVKILPSCPPGFVDICPLDPCMRKSIPREVEVVHCHDNDLDICPLDPCKKICPRIYEMVHCSPECRPIEICPLDPCRNVSPHCSPIEVCPLDPCRYMCPLNTLVNCTPEVQDSIREKGFSEVTKCPPDSIDICPLDPCINNCSVTICTDTHCQQITCTNGSAQNQIVSCPAQVCADVCTPAPQSFENACRKGVRSCQTIIHSTPCRCSQCRTACSTCAVPEQNLCSEEPDCSQGTTSKHVQFSCYKTCYEVANDSHENGNCTDNCNKWDHTFLSHPGEGEPCSPPKHTVSTVPLCPHNNVICSPAECSPSSCSKCTHSACNFRSHFTDLCGNQMCTPGDILSTTTNPSCTRGQCNCNSDMIQTCTTGERRDLYPNLQCTSEQCCDSDPNPSCTHGHCCNSDMNPSCTEGKFCYSKARVEQNCVPFCCNNALLLRLLLARCCENPCESVQCCCVPPCPVEKNVSIKIVLPECDLPAPKPSPPLSPSPELESLESMVRVISNITRDESSDSEEEVEEDESSDEEEPERLEVRVKSETTIDGVKRESSLTLVIESIESSDTESDDSLSEPPPLESVPVSLNSAPLKKRETNPWLIYLVVLLLLLAAMLAYCLFKKYCARQRYHRECFCKNVRFW